MAVGYDDRKGKHVPLVWRSSDGETWRRERLDPVKDSTGGVVAAVATRDDGGVIASGWVGSTNPPRDDGAVWSGTPSSSPQR